MDLLQEKACGAIEARLAAWQARLPADLSSVPTVHWENEMVEGHWITFGTQKRELASGATLVVCQALVHTWSRPTYLSLSAVGRAYAEGIVVSARGTVEAAKDELMWEFR
jgi:hypothetical protein